MGSFKQLSHLKNITRIYCSDDYNYAIDDDKGLIYSWGFGKSFVLGTKAENNLLKSKVFLKGDLLNFLPELIVPTKNCVYFID